MSRFRLNDILSQHPLAVVFAFITLCLLPVMMLRDFTPDNELRYLQIADEAIENGNAFAFTLDGEAYADKPPLYLWIIMLCKLLLGRHSMFLLSLFSLVPAFVTIGVVDRWGRPGNAVDRMGVAFLLMTCALFLGISVFLRMDMLMTMFITLALYSFWQLYEGTGNRRRQELLLPVWIFLALFTKGPVGLLMPPVAIICFLLVKRKGKDIGRYLGWKTWGIIAGLCVVWFTGVYLDGGREYLDNLLFHQTMGRAVNSFHHKAPIWYYLVAVWYMVAPYMFLLVGAVVASLSSNCRPGSRHGRPDRPSATPEVSDKETFFLVTVVSTSVMLSAFSAKLAIYLVPVTPFMVLLFLEVLRRTGWKKWMTWSLAVPCILVVLLALAALCALYFAPSDSRLGGLLGPYPFLRTRMVRLGLFLVAAGFGMTLYHLLKSRPGVAVISMGASLLLAVYAFSTVMPQLNDWIGYGNLCKTIPQDGRVATLYVRRPGPMKVYLGREVTDYQKDFKAFHEAEALRKGISDGPLVLVTRTSKMGGDPALDAYVTENPHWFVGPYCVVSAEPAGNDSVISETQ